MKRSIYFLSSATVALATLLTGCSDDATGIQTNETPEANYVGEATGNFSAGEWYGYRKRG